MPIDKFSISIDRIVLVPLLISLAPGDSTGALPSAFAIYTICKYLQDILYIKLFMYGTGGQGADRITVPEKDVSNVTDFLCLSRAFYL